MKLERNQQLVFALLAAVILALIIRGLFAIDSIQSLYSVMTSAFLIGTPFAVGYVCVYLCKAETIEYSAAAFFIPFIPIFIFFIITLAFGIEGLGCWIMIMPIFFVIAGLGGITARHFKLKKRDKTKSFVYIVVLLPF